MKQVNTSLVTGNSNIIRYTKEVIHMQYLLIMVLYMLKVAGVKLAVKSS